MIDLHFNVYKYILCIWRRAKYNMLANCLYSFIDHSWPSEDKVGEDHEKNSAQDSRG